MLVARSGEMALVEPEVEAETVPPGHKILPSARTPGRWISDHIAKEEEQAVGV